MVIRTDAWQDIEHKIGQKYRTQNRTNTSHKKSDKYIGQNIPQKIGQIFWTKSRTKKSDKNWTKTQTKSRINVPNKKPDNKNRRNMSDESDKNSNKTSD